MNPKEILSLKFKDDFGQTITIGNYLKLLLLQLWDEEENFNSKRPFGNSGWQFEIYKCLIKNGVVTGVIDEDGYVDHCDSKGAEKVIHEAIEYAFKGRWNE